MLLILGASALVTPLLVHAQVIRQEVPIMVGASVLVLLFAQDRAIGRLDGAVLLALLAAYTLFLIVQSRAETRASAADVAVSESEPGGRPSHWSLQLTAVLAGLLLLVLGSRWLVAACVDLATALGVSEAVIGLTVVSAGTSMPELATSITAALRGQRDMAIGNVVGSNIFNLLGCLGVSAIAAPDGLPVAAPLLAVDLWVMLAVALVCVPVFFTGRVIARWEGALFLLYYAAYTAWLVLAETGRDALAPFGNAMLSFVLPLTVLAVVVAFVRQRDR